MPSLHPLASLDQIQATPSHLDGLPRELEDDLRVYGCKLICQAGHLLKQKQVALATAQILYHRFWYASSMKQYGIGDMAMGALFLASKLEECPLRIRDLINVYDVLLQRSEHVLSSSTDEFEYKIMSYFSSTFYAFKDAIVVAEMQILKRLGFNAFVVLPYGTLINYMKVLGLVGNEEAMSKAWGYLNDALQTPVYTLFPIPTIVCSAILLCTRVLSIPLPESASFPSAASPNAPQSLGAWPILFDAHPQDIHSVCGYIMRLYRERRTEDREKVMRLAVRGRREVRAWLEERERR